MTLTDLFTLSSRWQLRQQNDGEAHFIDDSGDHLSAHHFPIAPDIQADTSDEAAVRSFYRITAQRHGLALVEAALVELAGCRAVRVVMKARLEPRGFAYIGSFTLPFADCSFVLKVQSTERGITGVRETAVLAMHGDKFEIDEATGTIAGWMQDPYDPTHRCEFMRNHSDDERYDRGFPDHPLTRVRRSLHEITESVTAIPFLRSLKPFVHKAPARPWWSRPWR